MQIASRLSDNITRSKQEAIDQLLGKQRVLVLDLTNAVVCVWGGEEEESSLTCKRAMPPTRVLYPLQSSAI